MAINDTFDGADGALVKDRAGWVQVNASNQPVLNGAGGVRSVDTTSSAGLTVHDTGNQSHFGEAVVGSDALSNSTTSCNFVVVKAPTSGSTSAAQYNISYADGTKQFRLRNGGSNIATATLQNPLAPGDVVRLEAQMAADNASVYLTAKINGNTVLGPITQTAYLTQTGVGFRAVGSQVQNSIITSFVADELGAADTTAPVLQANPALVATSATALTGDLVTDEGGPVFAVLYPAALAAPSAAQIEAGLDVNGNPAVARINGTILSIGENELIFTGGAAGTAYRYSAVQYDEAATPNRSNVVTSNSATTQAVDSINPVMPGPITIGKKSSGTIAFSFPPGTDNVGVTGYEYRVDGGPWMSLGTTPSGIATGLAQLTEYDIEASALDAAGNRSNIIAATTTTYRNGATGQYILDYTGPAGGNPAGILFNDVAAGDEDKWFSFTIVTPPANPGGLAINPDGSFTWTGSSADSFTYQMEVDGVNFGSPQSVTLAQAASYAVVVPLITSGEQLFGPTVAALVVPTITAPYLAPGEQIYSPAVSALAGAAQIVVPSLDCTEEFGAVGVTSTAALFVAVPFMPSDEQVWAPSLSLPASSIEVEFLPSDGMIWAPEIEVPQDGTGGLYLVTMAQARAHLRSDDADDNIDLELKIMAASEAVVDYLGDYAEDFANSDGTVKEGAVVPKRVQMATLLTIGYLYRERDGSQEHAVPEDFGYGFALPRGATALLYSLRKPVLA